MNIYALKGHRVKVTQITAKRGYSKNRLDVQEYLTVGKIYTVERTEVDSFHTDVYLKEIPSVCFNSVNFVDVDIQTEDQDKKHLDYASIRRYYNKK